MGVCWDFEFTQENNNVKINKICILYVNILTKNVEMKMTHPVFLFCFLLSLHFKNYLEAI